MSKAANQSRAAGALKEEMRGGKWLPWLPVREGTWVETEEGGGSLEGTEAIVSCLTPGSRSPCLDPDSLLESGPRLTDPEPSPMTGGLPC